MMVDRNPSKEQLAAIGEALGRLGYGKECADLIGSEYAELLIYYESNFPMLKQFFAKSVPSASFSIMGPVGVGKTTLAAMLQAKMWLDAYRHTFETAPRFVPPLICGGSRYRQKHEVDARISENRQFTLAGMLTLEYLVLDDFGAVSEFTDYRWRKVFDHRWSNRAKGFSTIVIFDRDPKQVFAGHKHWQATYSRWKDKSWMNEIVFRGQDKRQVDRV